MNPRTLPIRAETNQESAVAVVVAGNETGGQLALLELRLADGHHQPGHVHGHEDEIVYVLEGELTVGVDEGVYSAPAGTCLVFPRGTEHGFAAESGDARLLVILTPAGSEAYFAESQPMDGSIGVEQLITTAARFGISITGPAPTNGKSLPTPAPFVRPEEFAVR